MIYFVQEFEPKPGLADEEMREVYLRLAAGWQKAWPDNHLIGLFIRKWGVGPKPAFLALWELPDAHALDQWDALWPQVKPQMENLEAEFWASAVDVTTRLMERFGLE